MWIEVFILQLNGGKRAHCPHLVPSWWQREKSNGTLQDPREERKMAGEKTTMTRFQMASNNWKDELI